jgi:hypothetical protein
MQQFLKHLKDEEKKGGGGIFETEGKRLGLP